MNTAMTRRRERRFRAYIPLRVHSLEGVQTVVPRDVSTSACYFDFQKPDSLGEGSYQIEIPITDTESITIKNAVLFSTSSGFGFKWQLAPSEAARLFWFLDKRSKEPSTHSKVVFLAAEQKSLFQSFRDVADQKQKGYRFLFGLIAAYFIYLSAPLHFFAISSVEQAAFYSIGGIWASLILIYHCLRFLNWLGISIRRKAFLIHAMAAHRAWVFANDGSYYSKTIFPLGTTYDDSRTWKDKPEQAKLEEYPLSISYKGSTTVFHMMVQAFFAFGLILFVSILLRAVQQRNALLTGGFRLFDSEYVWKAYSGFCILLLVWIQNCAIGWSGYHRRIWEARRISAARPNPRFDGRALRKEQPVVYFGGIAVGVVVWVYALAALLVMLTAVHLPIWVPKYLDHWITTTVFVGGFLIGKILFLKIQFRAESNTRKISASSFSKPEKANAARA